MTSENDDATSQSSGLTPWWILSGETISQNGQESMRFDLKTTHHFGH